MKEACGVVRLVLAKRDFLVDDEVLAVCPLHRHVERLLLPRSSHAYGGCQGKIEASL